MYQDKRTKLYLPDNVRPRASGYGDAGASQTRRALKNFIARSGSPNEDIDWHSMTMRQRSRMLYMSSPLATSAVNTNRTKAVGVGLTLKSSIDRETLGGPESQLRRHRHERFFRDAAAGPHLLADERRCICPGQAVRDQRRPAILPPAAHH